jgi:hypothetical protein
MISTGWLSPAICMVVAGACATVLWLPATASTTSNEIETARFMLTSTNQWNLTNLTNPTNP